jgi:hypothetical protein
MGAYIVSCSLNYLRYVDSRVGMKLFRLRRSRGRFLPGLVRSIPTLLYLAIY